MRWPSHGGVITRRTVVAHADLLDQPEVDQRLHALFPENLDVHVWNRKVVQMGMSEMGREALMDTKRKMGLEDRNDLLGFADMVEVDEGRIPGFPAENDSPPS